MQKKRQLTLAQYVRRRNGLPLGASGSLTNMLSRSLGAGSLSKFWQYWNPIWGYYLGRYIHAPLKKHIPVALSLIITFTVSGLLHDVVITLIRGSMAFIFTPWFFLVATGIVIGEVLRIDYSRYSWFSRAAINVSYIVSCLAIVLLLE